MEQKLGFSKARRGGALRQMDEVRQVSPATPGGIRNGTLRSQGRLIMWPAFRVGCCDCAQHNVGSGTGRPKENAVLRGAKHRRNASIR